MDSHLIKTEWSDDMDLESEWKVTYCQNFCDENKESAYLQFLTVPNRKGIYILFSKQDIFCVTWFYVYKQHSKSFAYVHICITYQNKGLDKNVYNLLT